MSVKIKVGDTIIITNKAHNQFGDECIVKRLIVSNYLQTEPACVNEPRKRIRVIKSDGSGSDFWIYESSCEVIKNEC